MLCISTSDMLTCEPYVSVPYQIPAKRGPALRFIVEANIKALMSKSNTVGI